MSVATVKPKLDRNIYKKTAELIYLINKIYNHNDNGNDRHFKGVDMDYSSFRNNQEMSLKQLMKLIQKNYDAKKNHKNDPKIRVNFISNPEVLEQFQKALKDKEVENSFDYHESDSSRKLKEILSNLRRQAVFRIADPESEEMLVPEEQQNLEAIQQSVEGNPEKVNTPEEATAIKNGRKKEVESKEKVDTWDIITKKYDWDKDNWDTKDTKDWGGNEGKILVEKKKDNKKIDKWDDWRQKKDKMNKKKDTHKLDYWEQTDNKLDDKIHDKKKPVDKFDNWGQTKDKKDNKWDDIGKDKEKDNRDDWEKNKKTEAWEDIDKPKPKKAKVEIKWDEPKNKRKGSELKEKKHNEWDTKWDKKDNWDNWETTRQRRKTTKRLNQASYKINEWDHFAPKMQNKPKRYENERHIPMGAFARTSIPFVGKKGIYEDR